MVRPVWSRGYSGDGEAAIEAELKRPLRHRPHTDGGFLIADGGNKCIRKVTPGKGLSVLERKQPVSAKQGLQKRKRDLEKRKRTP